MHCHDHLAAIFVTPFLAAARLGNHRKTLTTSLALQTGYRRLTAPRVRSFLPLWAI
jgi:hypothetical protein